MSRRRLAWFDMRPAGHDLAETDPAALRVVAAVRLLPFGWRFVRDAEMRDEPDVEVVEVGPAPRGAPW